MLSKLLAKAKSLLGLGSSESTGAPESEADTTAESAEAAYECAVCGTEVADPDGTCSLCRSSDIVPAGEADTQPSENFPENAKTTRSRDNPDDAAERLRKLREEQEETDPTES